MGQQPRDTGGKIIAYKIINSGEKIEKCSQWKTKSREKQKGEKGQKTNLKKKQSQGNLVYCLECYTN